MYTQFMSDFYNHFCSSHNTCYIICVFAVETTYVHVFPLPFTDTFILQNCTVTSPSIGTIRISCDSPYQILVTLKCSDNCNNHMVTIFGSSPLTVRGLDPGMLCSVTINVFNGTQVLFMELKMTENITVMDNNLGTLPYI